MFGNLFSLKISLSLFLSQKLPMNIRKNSIFNKLWAYAMHKEWGEKKKLGCRRVKSRPNVAMKQLQSRKKGQQKYRDTTCKANFFPFYLTQASKIYAATSRSVVWLETIEISEQRTAFTWIFAQEVEWALADHCIYKRLKNLPWLYWRLIWRQNCFDMYHWALGCSKKFHFGQLKIKVAPQAIIVSLDTLKPAFVCFLSDVGRKWLPHLAEITSFE